MTQHGGGASLTQFKHLDAVGASNIDTGIVHEFVGVGLKGYHDDDDELVNDTVVAEVAHSDGTVGHANTISGKGAGAEAVTVFGRAWTKLDMFMLAVVSVVSVHVTGAFDNIWAYFLSVAVTDRNTKTNRVDQPLAGNKDDREEQEEEKEGGHNNDDEDGGHELAEYARTVQTTAASCDNVDNKLAECLLQTAVDADGWGRYATAKWREAMAAAQQAEDAALVLENAADESQVETARIAHSKAAELAEHKIVQASDAARRSREAAERAHKAAQDVLANADYIWWCVHG